MSKSVELTTALTVRELSATLETSPISIIKALMGMGVMANINGATVANGHSIWEIHISEFTHFDRAAVKQTAIPLGRSLQRDANSGDFFGSPRIVVASQASRCPRTQASARPSSCCRVH